MNMLLSEVYDFFGAQTPQNFKNQRVGGVSTDTRTVEPGDIFFALTGENFDGHDFADVAAKKGAQLLILSKSVLGVDAPQIVVEDTLEAMQKLASYYRQKLNIPIFAVTGSSGKTTTKDMLAHILLSKFKTYSTKKNFNNLIGAPRSVFEVDETYKTAVFELGMNRTGEIDILSRIIRPNAAIITNIGLAHIGYLKSREAIFKAKSEIANGLMPGGKLILNSDDDLLLNFANGDYEIIFAGSAKNAGNFISFDDVAQSNVGVSFNLIKDGATFSCFIPVLGLHNVSDAVLAISAACCAGVKIEEAVAALSTYAPSSMRSEVSNVKGVVIIKDYYNANPESTKAALETLSKYQTSGKKTAILGDMGELGDFAAEEHAKIGEICKQLNIDAIYFGDYVKEVKLANYDGITAFSSKNDAIQEIKSRVSLGKISVSDAILMKASRFVKMEEVYESLKSFINAEYSDYVALPPSPTRLYVDVTALKGNYNNLRRALNGAAEIMPAVKANAYGCGAEIVANVLSGCRYLAVADAKEASMLRRVLRDTNFVIIYQPPLMDIPAIVSNGYIPAVCNLEFVEKLNAEAAKCGKKIKVHVEIDTGMGRLGVLPEDVSTFFTALKKLPNIIIEGIFMHYSSADCYSDEDLDFTAHQTNVFNQSIKAAEEIVGNIPLKHACAGAAIFNKNCATFNMVRPGYMLYGYYPNEQLKSQIKLQPALKFASAIVHIKTVPKDMPISYSRTYKTNRATVVATVAAGYSDGINRKLSNVGYVAVNGQKAPIIGRICMDLTMIDITDIDGSVKIGDEVFFFDNTNITVDNIANLCGTIGYEIIAQTEDKADRVEMF